MTVHEIATARGYSHGYMREALRDLRREGQIEGAKIDQVIACNVQGETIVLTSNFDRMMEDLEDASGHLAKKARSEVAPGDVDELHDFIKRHASSTYTIERRWEFWYPTATSPAGGSPSPAASAD